MSKLVFVSLIFFGAACAPKQDQEQLISECKQAYDDATGLYNLFLLRKTDVDLNLAQRLVEKSLKCDSLNHLNHWLKIRLYGAKLRYDSALIALNKFERFADGPALRITKAQLFDEIGEKDSAIMNFKIAAAGYDELIPNEPDNVSNILARLTIVLRLEGKQKAIEKLEMYKRQYPSMPQLDSFDESTVDLLISRAQVTRSSSF